MRFLQSVLIVVSVLSVTGTCLGQAPTAASVQAAVNQAVDWTQTGGSVTVVGVREVPGQNEATADLQFNNFQYNADFMKTPRPKSERTPAGNPAVVYIPPSATRNVLSYSGSGVASMTHYTDGRWVLTRIDFNFVQITSTVLVATNSAPAQVPRPAVSTSLTAASVQAAVNQAVAWTQTGGSITVAGVRELPGQNEATADLQFNNFQYNADFMKTPRPKDERTPQGNPAVVFIPPSATRNFLNYSGPGLANMTHYTDGRWVLTRIDFNFVQITSSISVLPGGGGFNGSAPGISTNRTQLQPSSSLKTFQGSGFEISFPANWNVKETSPGMTYYFGLDDRLQATPIVLGTGMIAGNFETQIVGVRAATDRFIELLTANTGTSRQHDESLEVLGREWYSVLLDGKNAQGGRENDWVIATQHPPGLFFIIFVAPRESFDGSRPQFTRALESVRLQ